MGLIDYLSRNPVGLTIPTSEYDEEFVVASINAFINNLDLIDNVILNNLANQNKAPFELIKKRAKNKGLLDSNLNTQLTTKHSKHSSRGQMQTHNHIQFHSKFANKQSALSHLANSKKQSDHKIVNFIQQHTMSRRAETRGCKGRFIPTELKNTDSRGRTTESTTQLPVSSDREESLSDPRLHKRLPAKGEKVNPSTAIKNSQNVDMAKIQEERVASFQCSRSYKKITNHTARRHKNFPVRGTHGPKTEHPSVKCCNN